MLDKVNRKLPTISQLTTWSSSSVKYLSNSGLMLLLLEVLNVLNEESVYYYK